MMPAGTQTAKTKKKRRQRKTPIILRVLQLMIIILISPVLLIWDSFRNQESTDRSWLYSFFLFTTLVMFLTGAGFLICEGPALKTVKMLAALSGNREILPGNIQPEIAMINRYAVRNDVDPLLIYAIIKTESGFNTKAVSAAGAKGLMQLMPETWQAYSHSTCTGKHKAGVLCPALPNCIYAPEANIRTGITYFHELLVRYNHRVDLALEAYNAGISNVITDKPQDQTNDQATGASQTKFSETGNYIEKTIIYWQDLRRNMLDGQLKLALRLQNGLKVLFGLLLFCWFSLFWWAGRKLFQTGTSGKKR